MGDALVQTAKVFVLVPERVARLAAAFLDALGQLDHLIDGLLAVEPHDVVEAELAAGFLALVWERGKGFDEHGNHDLRPALADEGEGAVEVQQDVAEVWPGRKERAEFDAADEPR